ncbi:hypothetical protein COB21_04740 [Candidatus Aerophobetes bacterium]|uniref:Uncharacterized protein n=1 Tax=Aerophobetes bacterium TaxID=2030807 RepID=A0A2A4X248_UNCAE|nr:MAG: hypothetical protein COB21_04740 [Candidatus Aerophobetes bacterium]
MNRLKNYILILCSFPLLLCATSIQDRLKTAETGSYIVTEQGRNTTLLHFHSKNNHILLFEEITAPSFICDKIPFDWKSWVKKGAPGSSSWILYTLNLDQGNITTCYCVKNNQALSSKNLNIFFSVLCNLPLQLVSEEKRIATSATPKPGQVGTKIFWSPPQTFEGKLNKNAPFELFSAKWPKDKTPLSGETLFAYFDKSKPTFPFPFWIQAGKALKVKIKTIDAGTEMISPALIPSQN